MPAATSAVLLHPHPNLISYAIIMFGRGRPVIYCYCRPGDLSDSEMSAQINQPRPTHFHSSPETAQQQLQMIRSRLGSWRH